MGMTNWCRKWYVHSASTRHYTVLLLW